MNREGKNLPRRLLSLRQSPPPSNVRVSIKWRRMYRRGIVDPRFNVLVPQLIHNLIPLSGVHTSQANGIQVPAVSSTIGLFRQEQFSAHAQLLSGQLSILPPLFKERGQLPQLRVTDRRCNLRHVIIVTWPNGPVWTLFSVRTDHSQGLSIPIVVCRNHPSFAGCNILASVETETSHVGDRANFSPIELGAVSLSRVFNYNNVFSMSQIRYSRNIGGEAVEIRRNDSFRLT